MAGDGNQSDGHGGTGTLPYPTGQFPVGRSRFEMLDPLRAEIYSDNPADKRELVTWIWYPAAALTGSEPAVYVPAAWQSVDQLLGVNLAAVRCYAISDPPLSGSLPSFPVLFFSPSGFPPLMWAAIAEELASHGYFVVGVNHTYETTVTAFSDGRIKQTNPAAIAGVLGPQQGPHDAAFRARGAVCDYKAADLRSVADWLAACLRSGEEIDRCGPAFVPLPMSGQVSGQAEDPGRWGAAFDDPPAAQAGSGAEQHPRCAVTVLGVPQPAVGDLPAGCAGMQGGGRRDQVGDAAATLGPGVVLAGRVAGWPPGHVGRGGVVRAGQHRVGDLDRPQAAGDAG